MSKKESFFQFNIRNWVFWPPFILLILAVIFSILSPGIFIRSLESIQGFLLANFSLGFSWVSFGMTILGLLVFFSPLGKRRIGGKNAKPRLNRLSWFAIVLCTTIAVGILFWGSAEPLSHFLYPPDFKNNSPLSLEAARFSMGALFFHWGFTPYAIYIIPALAFALFYYQGKNKPSISLAARPILGSNPKKFWENIIDSISLFALVTGMSGSLGAGILSLTGGFVKYYPQWNVGVLSGVITLVILLTFIISSSTGIEKGIKNLSLFNLFFFFLIAILFVFVGEKTKILNSISTGFLEYGKNFFDLSLQLSGAGNSWTYDWSVFNFAIWMAWAPVTALFLGKIALGRTVREFLLFNWFLPGLLILKEGAALAVVPTTCLSILLATFFSQKTAAVHREYLPTTDLSTLPCWKPIPNTTMMMRPQALPFHRTESSCLYASRNMASSFRSRVKMASRLIATEFCNGRLISVECNESIIGLFFDALLVYMG